MTLLLEHNFTGSEGRHFLRLLERQKDAYLTAVATDTEYYDRFRLQNLEGHPFEKEVLKKIVESSPYAKLTVSYKNLFTAEWIAEDMRMAFPFTQEKTTRAIIESKREREKAERRELEIKQREEAKRQQEEEFEQKRRSETVMLRKETKESVWNAEKQEFETVTKVKYIRSTVGAQEDLAHFHWVLFKYAVKVAMFFWGGIVVMCAVSAAVSAVSSGFDYLFSLMKAPEKRDSYNKKMLKNMTDQSAAKADRSTRKDSYPIVGGVPNSLFAEEEPPQFIIERAVRPDSLKPKEEISGKEETQMDKKTMLQKPVKEGEINSLNSLNYKPTTQNINAHVVPTVYRIATNMSIRFNTDFVEREYV